MSRPPIQHEQIVFRLNQVHDFIDTNLRSDLCLDRLAEEARFSRYHFLRVFYLWNGETPYAYVRRRRLEVGASQLLYSTDSVTTIANECGFDTADGFSRAFRHYFGATPLSWRHQAPRHATQKKEPGNDGICATWPVRIAHFPATRVAYTRHIGPYDETRTDHWRRTTQWMQQNGLRDAVRFGMGLDDPSFTPPAKCRYDVCVALPDSFVAPLRTSIKTIVDGKYAVLRFDGPARHSNQAWHFLLEYVVSIGKYKVAALPAFERYCADMPDPDNYRQNCEFCLPLELQTNL